jgi:F420-dependent oxidoreductase-like protein
MTARSQSHAVRFGVQSGQQMGEWPQMLDLWRKADAWGYDSLWNFDHFYAVPGPPDQPCLEGWTTLAALAQATRRARVGMLVGGNTYRHPCITAKMAATVDHISGGRLILGLGAGWFELEHRSFGIDFKTARGRLEALDEACQIVRGMFTRERTTLRGKHYTVSEVIGRPRPLQPHVPLMIGGTGQRVLLRIVARHADMWNAAGSAERLRDLIDVIRRHGDAVDRDPAQIEKTVMLPLCYRAPAAREEFMCGVFAALHGITPADARAQLMIGGKQECLDTVSRYVAAGVTHLILAVTVPYLLDEVQAFAEEVIPAARSA